MPSSGFAAPEDPEALQSQFAPQASAPLENVFILGGGNRVEEIARDPADTTGVVSSDAPRSETRPAEVTHPSKPRRPESPSRHIKARRTAEDHQAPKDSQAAAARRPSESMRLVQNYQITGTPRTAEAMSSPRARHIRRLTEVTRSIEARLLRDPLPAATIRHKRKHHRASSRVLVAVPKHVYPEHVPGRLIFHRISFRDSQFPPTSTATLLEDYDGEVVLTVKSQSDITHARVALASLIGSTQLAHSLYYLFQSHLILLKVMLADSVEFIWSDTVMSLSISVPPGPASRHIVIVMGELSPFFHSVMNSTSPDMCDPNKLYQMLLKSPECPLTSLSPPAIHTDLYPHQKRALFWMKWREDPNREYLEIYHTSNSLIHPLWYPVVSLTGDTYFYSPYSGCLSYTMFTSSDSSISGGILADDMGLGKSLDVLALVCANPHPQRTAFKDRFTLAPLPAESATKSSTCPGARGQCTCFCGSIRRTVKCSSCGDLFHPDCNMIHRYSDGILCSSCEGSSIESMGTLIVCPDTILLQWCDEILKHVIPGSLSWYRYESVSTMQDRGSIVSPRFLSTQDIVLTSYSTLRTDLNYYSAIRDSPRLQKRYKSPPSPLLRLNWWRVCLDEAQMVDSRSAKVSESASHLQGIHRWCISGTPIKRSMDDLHGLLSFLHAMPYDDHTVFNQAVSRPLSMGNPLALRRLQDFLSPIIWRTIQETLSSDGGLLIPVQHEKEIRLSLNAIEWNFYNRQKHECVQQMESKLLSLNRRPSAVRQCDLRVALPPLLKLRQACCHPQIGNSNSSVSRDHHVLTMREVLSQLISSLIRDCEENQRKVISSYNGLAGVQLLLEQPDLARQYYTSAVSMIEGNSNLFRSDLLQSFHTYFHLAKLLPPESHERPRSRCYCSSPCSLCYESHAEDLHADYLESVNNQVDQAVEHLNEVSHQIEDPTPQHSCVSPLYGNWWKEALSALETAGMLWQFLAQSLDGEMASLSEFEVREEFITRHMRGLTESRAIALAEMIRLSEFPNQSLILEARQCRICQNQKTGSVCRQCEAHRLIDAYNRFLMDYKATPTRQWTRTAALVSKRDREPNSTLQNDLTQTIEHSVFIFLRKLLNMIRGMPSMQHALSDGQYFFEQLARYKEERFRLTNLWKSEKHRLLNVDELAMSALQLTLVDSDGCRSASDRSWKLCRYELHPMENRLQNELNQGLYDLQCTRGQLMYLRSLEGSLDKSSEFSCPICMESLSQRPVSVFPCGHMFSEDCVANLLERSRRKTVCPVCKDEILVSSVTTVSTSESRENLTPSSPLISSHPSSQYSTKITQIVETLKEIKGVRSQNSKCIIFSEWEEVFDILEEALDENQIVYFRYTDKKRRDHILQAFKECSDFCAIFIMFKNGGEGLTLIEATNVLLVEPLLNPALEAQAIGRVHRIGQSEETYVYRFITVGTVEERIAAMNRSHESMWKTTDSSPSASMTLDDLNGLVSSLKSGGCVSVACPSQSAPLVAQDDSLDDHARFWSRVLSDGGGRYPLSMIADRHLINRASPRPGNSVETIMFHGRRLSLDIADSLRNLGTAGSPPGESSSQLEGGTGSRKVAAVSP